MKKAIAMCACVMLVLGMILSVASYAEEKQSAGQKFASFWQKLFNYPANLTNETAGVISDTALRATKVVTNEIKTVGQVTSGEVDKTKNLITQPLVGTAETAKKAVEGTVAAPIKAGKDNYGQ